MISPEAIFLISAGCMFGGALVGLLLSNLLPEHHLRDNSKDTVKVVAGMIATVAALVLGLLVGSAKNSFDAMNTELTQSSTKVILLDRVLAAYGPETKDARERLRSGVATVITKIWPEEKTEEAAGLAEFLKFEPARVAPGEAAPTHAGHRSPAPTARAGAADQQ